MTPYAYRPGGTVLHRASAGLKLLGLFFISVTGFFSGWFQVAGGAVIVLGAVLAGIRPWELFRGCAPLAWAGLLVVLMRTIRFGGDIFGFLEVSFAGFIGGLRFCGGLLLAFCTGSLLFSVTTMAELRDSLSEAEFFLFKRIKKKKREKSGKKNCKNEKKRKEEAYQEADFKKISALSLSVSLMLGFLPRFFEVWEDAEAAYFARGGRKGFGELILLIPLVTERMIEAAAETASAMEARGIGLY
jgi:biotin transport system permease protein